MELTKSISTLGYDAALELYETARFVDAFSATQHLWHDKSNSLKLDVRETILAARLATRLGSYRFSRALFDFATKRAPDDPMVRYYCRGRVRRSTLFQDLAEFSSKPELDTDDADLKASWFASHASTFALVRDFESAERWMERAYAQESARGWVESCHAEILLRQDLREEALLKAEDACRKQPGMPYCAGTLAAALSDNNRADEAVERLRTWVEPAGQSFEVLLILMRQVLQSMERGDAAKRTQGAQYIYELATRFAALAPLADRFAQRQLNYSLIEAARLTGDHARLTELAVKLDAPFYNSVAKNLAKNPGGARVVLPHQPVRQDHNTCLPASVCTVLSGLGLSVKQEDLARELTFEGTPGWRVGDWAEKNGMRLRHFIADRASVEALIGAGVPFVIGFEYLNNAHACAVVGADLATGTILIHDPSLNGMSEQLFDFMGAGEAPLGPRCAVIYPLSLAPKLDALKLSGESAALARQEFQRVRERDGALACAKFAKTAGLGDTPNGAFLESMALSANGKAAESLAIMQRLLEKWPDCTTLQRGVIAGTEAMGNTALTRDALRKILARSPLPGASGGTDYIYPAPHLYARYADLLRRSAASLAEAMRVSQQALRRGPFEAEAYVVRGEIHWHQGQFAEALLPYRFASTLHYENDVYARYFADALHKLGREREAVAWLERRARHFVHKLDAPGPQRVLVDTLEDFGFPGEALAQLRQSLRERPEDGSLAAFAVPVFSRYAKHQEAAQALEVARLHAPKGEYHNAASALARVEGNLPKALEHAKLRVEHEPTFMGARAVLLHYTEQLNGPDEALKLCVRWQAEHPGDEDYEQLLLDRLDRATHRERRIQLLRARLKRNEHDAWAWRELAFTLLESASMASSTRRIDATRDVEATVKRCVDTSPDHHSTLSLQAEILVLKGEREKAFVYFARALQIEPTFMYALNRLFDLAGQLGPKFGKKVADVADAALARMTGQWSLAPAIADRLGQMLGVDEARNRVSRWLRRARRDPYPVSAWAELLLYHGKGVSDARRVVRRLKRAIARFPLHTSLRYALAHAYSNLQRPEDEVLVLKEIVDNAPHEMRARVYLSETLEQLGRLEEAEAELKRASEVDALEFRVWSGLSEFYVRRRRNEDAIAVLAAGCAKSPDAMPLWERRIELLGEAGRAEEALGVAKEVAKRYPNGVVAQLILARAMRHPLNRARRQDVEAQYEKALKLDAQYFEGVEEFSEFLCTHAQYKRARAVIERHMPLAEDPVAFSLKLAEISRREGHKKEALEAAQEIVKKRPDYYWGWNLLLQWCTEDKRWMVGRGLVKNIGPALQGNAALQAQKLEFLQEAGAPLEEIELGWQELLLNFPQHRELNLRRFDLLLNAKRLDDAELVIENYARFEPDASFTLCRQIEVACLQHKQERALELARRLWFESKGVTWKACIEALDALGPANFAKANMEAVCAQIERGKLPDPSATRALAFTAGKNGLGKELERFATLLEPRALGYGSWDVFVNVLDSLIDCERGYFVMAFRNRHNEDCWNNTQLFMVLGRALHVLRKHSEAVQWLTGWRDRAGVELWGISNLVYSLLALGRYDEASTNANTALQELQHDHAAPDMVEGLLLGLILGDATAMALRENERLHEVLNRAEKPSLTAQALDLFMQMLTTQDRAALLRQDAQFMALTSRNDMTFPAALRAAWRRQLKQRLPWFSWAWLNLKGLLSRLNG